MPDDRRRRGARSRSRRRASAAPTCTSTAGTSGRAADPAAADARPRVRRHGRRDRPRRPPRRRRRLRLGREPRHLRRVLPVPHRPRAHVRADADPRRRPRRRVRALRRRAGVGDLAERPHEAAARDRDAAGAVRERRLRDQRSRTSPGRSVAVLGCGPVGLFTIAIARASGAAARVRLRPDAVPARPRRDDGRHDAVERRRGGGRRPAWFLEQNEGYGTRRRLRDVGLARAIADAFRIARNGGRVRPLRDPVAAGRDRRRRVADLQEPDRAGAERPPDLRDVVQDALAARAAASSTCGR